MFSVPQEFFSDLSNRLKTYVLRSSCRFDTEIRNQHWARRARKASRACRARHLANSEFTLKVIYNLSTKHTNKIWKWNKMFYLSLKAISTSGSKNGMFGYLLLRLPYWILNKRGKFMKKLTCHPASSPTANLDIETMWPVDTVYKGIEMISIRNGTLKRARLASGWLCGTFQPENKICTKRANHIAILQPFLHRSWNFSPIQAFLAFTRLFEN